MTPAMGLRLAELLGNAPNFWLDLHGNCVRRTLEPRMADELAAIVTLDAA